MKRKASLNRVKNSTPILLITGAVFVVGGVAGIFQLYESPTFTAALKKAWSPGSRIVLIQVFVLAVSIIAVASLWYKVRSLLTHLPTVNKNLLDVKEVIREVSRANQLIETKGEFYLSLQELLARNRNSTIYIVGLHREWIYKFVFTLFISRSRGNKITVLTPERSEDEKRNRLLISLGCELKFVDEEGIRNAFRGVIANPEKKSDCQAIHIYEHETPIYAKDYAGEIDFPSIKLFFQELHRLSKTIDVQPEHPVPELQDETELSVLDRMQSKISFYRNAEFEFREVVIGTVTPVSSFVEKFKLNQANEIIQTYKTKKLPMFTPMAIRFSTNSTSSILPPVLEERNGELYVAEGHSRLYSLWKAEPTKRVRVIVVKGVESEFTTQPTSWDRVSVTTDKIPLGQNGQRLARNIEAQFRD